MTRIFLILLLLGVVVYYNPWVLETAGSLTGITSGGQCDAVESYFTQLSEGDVSAAMEYKLSPDRPRNWVDDIDAVADVDCTCSADLSDNRIQNINNIPDSVANVTDTQLTVFSIDGTVNGEDATVTGWAFTFRALANNWFVTQETRYAVDGEPVGGIQIPDMLSECELP